MRVLVNGIGNIGTTILNVLLEYKSTLGISTIYALKNGLISDWNRRELQILQEKGVVICTRNKDTFESLNAIIDSVNYIFDCNANTYGLKNKPWYESLPNLIGCSAQGSEKGFGIPFMSGINDHPITNEKFVQIVSCNTHSLSSILTTFTGSNLSNLNYADFVIVRRSEDIGNHQRLVSANVVSRHLDTEVGTHHAIDVKDLFKTLSINPHVQSSDITTPSQLMHSVRFSIKLKQMHDAEKFIEQIDDNSFVSTTAKFDSNIIFELGRKYSAFGRLFSHTIINSNNLLFDYKTNRIKGWAFIPQEGNTILSSIHAFLLQTNFKHSETAIALIKQDLIKNEW